MAFTYGDAAALRTVALMVAIAVAQPLHGQERAVPSSGGGTTPNGFCVRSTPHPRCKATLVFEPQLFWAFGSRSQTVTEQRPHAVSTTTRSELGNRIDLDIGVMLNRMATQAYGAVVEVGTSGSNDRAGIKLGARRWFGGGARRLDLSAGIARAEVRIPNAAGDDWQKETARGLTADLAFGSRDLLAVTAGIDMLRGTRSTSAGYVGVRTGPWFVQSSLKKSIIAFAIPAAIFCLFFSFLLFGGGI